MNMLKHELKQNWGATISWIIGLLAVVALYIALFPAISATPDAAKVLKSFPAAFKRVFGMTDLTFSLFPSMYAVVMNLVALIGAVQAMNIGTGIIAKEIRDKTAEFLLSKPVTRFNVLSQKLISALILLIITNLIYLVMSWIMIQAIIKDPFSFEVFLRSSSMLFFVQMFFLAFGFLLGIVIPKTRSVIAVTLPTVFGFYILGLLDTVIGEEKIKYFTPFRLFDAIKLTGGANYEIASLVYLGILLAISVIGSYFIYNKKDIQTT